MKAHPVLSVLLGATTLGITLSGCAPQAYDHAEMDAWLTTWSERAGASTGSIGSGAGGSDSEPGGVSFHYPTAGASVTGVEVACFGAGTVTVSLEISTISSSGSTMTAEAAKVEAPCGDGFHRFPVPPVAVVSEAKVSITRDGTPTVWATRILGEAA